ncbi:hypothetical protein [Leptothoe spongobia]|uniref:Peptidase domain-containing protein n=1 Tax=Leptothoe spongobia TAU-MAC 1115 TaxID=1967444 RepID=A0A947DC88_9CYAN|nr:hypothetical protein [Leptothoe spongobia]MBT9313819.1 hypothetical protein [Leptothoe spongobia TAU-MAC 1115]
MKNIATKNIASLLIAATMAAAPTAAVYGQSATEISGTSGGPQTSTECGFVPAQPDYSFNITQPTASVSIAVTGSNDYTLLMVGPDNNSRECILAHDFDGGTIQSRGLYKAGTYHLYVGDIDGDSAPFTLTIQQ